MWALHESLVRMMKKVSFWSFSIVFYCFQPCERMRKHAFAGWNTQQFCKYLFSNLFFMVMDANEKTKIKLCFFLPYFAQIFLMKIYFLVLQITVLNWDLAFYIIINKSLNYIVVNFYNLSSLHWLDLKFLYALFVQWSILATKKTKFPPPPPIV